MNEDETIIANNGVEEIKYFKAVRNDFEGRFINAKKEFNRHLSDNHDYSHALINKMLLLYDTDPLTFWAFFQKIIGHFESIDGLENFNSFVGNFYDDAFFVMTYDLEELDRIKENNEFLHSIFPDQEQKHVHPEQECSCWRIEWGKAENDADNAVTEKELFNILDRLTEDAKKTIDTIKNSTLNKI